MPFIYSLLRITLLPAFLLSFFAARAQTPAARFPEDPSDFVSQLGQFMTASKRPDMEEAFSVFKKQVQTGMINPGDLKRVTGVSNQLAALNLTPFPYFKNYINAVTGAASNADTTLFDRWHAQAEQVMASAERGKSKPIAAYLEFSAAFTNRRALKIGEGGSATWRIRGSGYRFEFTDGKPLLRCNDVELICARKVDSVSILGASGVFQPTENIWTGQGGRVHWTDAGLDSSIYAELTRYKIEVIKPLFECDTAYLHYPLYFGERPIAGRFEDNIIAESRANTAYPRFESFEKTLKIGKIGEGIEYVGGFRLNGNSLYGYGSSKEPAQLTIYNKKRQRIFYGTGQLFVIKREVSIVAEGVNAKLFMDQDSLFHPAVDFRVEIPNQIIQLTRGEKGSERNPFFSSFYNMNLNTEKIAWHIARDSLEIGARAGVVKGVAQKVEFESSNRFDVVQFNAIQHIASQNPIATLFVLSKETGSNIVSDDAFAQRINPKFDYSSIQTLLAQMVAEGFINYYFDRHEIELRDKLIHYALASQGKKDYDAINIESESTGANARLDLRTKETTIFDVKKIELSNRQRVAIMPREKTMTLLQNRDMRFDGRLFAGFALFEGKNMHFTYDKFQVEMDSVRHLDFYLPTGNKTKDGQPEANSMNSTVEYVSGVLLVDAPNNKSGKEDLAIFPSLQTKKPSFVFYDRKSIQGGVYTRDSFYFKLDPFAFNGLDSYTPEALRFKGEMTAATIFPPFKETIVVREEDKSFGFVHRTPQTGYPTYSKKGLYTGELDLSNKGFLGRGKVEYLTADIESEDLIFRPRQMTGTAKKFFMEEDRKSAVKVPQARGENVSVNWLPYRDSMYVESKAKDFELFKAAGYNHRGILILTPSGLKGKGVFEWAGGKLTSKLISYGPFQASADTADLQIKALNGNDIAFDSRNIDGELDFDAQRGDFKANSEDANTSLPLDQYLTSMNEFTWDMRAQTITFKADPNKPAVFVSSDPDQDSLRFEGKTAIYDMKTNLLKIGGVQVIKSADAFIYPDSVDIEIQPGGRMTQLTNARIVADTVSRYHTINRATVDILGKKLYKATGYYEYNIPGYNQEIFFNNIIGERRGPGTKITKNVLTTAAGELAEKDSFRMDVKTLFKGKIILSANKTNLRFEGFGRLDADKLPLTQWFSVFSEVDKNDPTIQIKTAKNGDDMPMATGFYLSNEFGTVYPNILLPALQRMDRMVLDCNGVYKYDSKTDRFTFGDSLKVLGQSMRGGKMVFDNRVGTVQGEGALNLGSGLEFMKIKAAGRLKSDYNKPDTVNYFVSGEFMTGMEILLPKSLFDVLINDIRASTFDAQGGIYNTNMAFYQPALSEFIPDDKDFGEANANLATNLLTLPKKYDKFAFLLGRHPVIWNDEYQSFLSMEDKFPLISINGEPINKVLTMYVEYRMPTNEDDRFYLYIKAAPDLWYFFGYQTGVLNVASSSTRFNDALLKLKSKETQIKMPNGELYEIIAANPSIADAFVNRVKQGRKRE